MNKLACGIVALGLMAGSLFAADSYYIFSVSNGNKVAWGAENYVFGYTYGTVTLDNPANPYSEGSKDFVNEGVGKIINASISASSGVFIGVKKLGEGAANDKSITDCTQGFSYWYKGGAHDVNLEYGESNCTGTVKWNNKWRASVPASPNWNKKTISLSDLVQVTAANGCNKTSVDLSIAEQLVWGTETAAATATSYNLMIGNVACLVSGAMTGDVAPTAGFAWAAAAEDICTGKYCKWETCGVISTDKSGAGGTVTATCEAAIANCAANSPSKTVYSNPACTAPIVLPSSSSTAASSSSGTSSSSNGDSSSSGTATSSPSGDTSSSSGTATSSPSGTSSSSSGETDPIISYNRAPVVGLSVVNFARNLRIASDKNATIYLFDINGKQVLSQKVLKGTTTISLGKQKVGVYYAVAKSDSQKQIVKIVLK